MSATVMPLQLWDDNPSVVDLLGFSDVVSPIVEAIGTPKVDPLAIGVHSPWGGGKSTILNLLEDRLEQRGGFVVVRTDPWQYDNHVDVRGDLIVEVLDQLAQHFDADAGIKAWVADLIKRISWTRVGLALGKGALTMQWDPEKLIEAFTPKTRSDDLSMSGFKEAFAGLIKALPEVDRVVVLVDDLDRCLPAAVMATLESIKLFLAVPKMAFVIAADQEMVRDSIAVSLGETNRSSAFAVRYLDKIVQLPVTVPRLNIRDAEAYIGMLLSRTEGATDDALTDLAKHCAKRREENQTPLLGGLDELSWKPERETLDLAAQLAQGLSADRLANPRQIKRFLNAFGVRSMVARSRKVDVAPALLMKLLLLEDLHRTSFETLAATAAPDRRDLLTQWEAWSQGVDGAQRPVNIEESTKHWANSQPSLASAELGQYLDLAASLIHVRSGEQASDDVIRHIQEMLNASEAVREAGLSSVCALGETEQRAAMDLLFQQGRHLDDVDSLFGIAIKWAEKTPTLVDLVAAAAEDLRHKLTTGAVVNMGQSALRETFLSVLTAISNDAGADFQVRSAATMELEPSSGH